jgi:hypothetical protein
VGRLFVFAICDYMMVPLFKSTRYKISPLSIEFSVEFGSRRKHLESKVERSGRAQSAYAIGKTRLLAARPFRRHYRYLLCEARILCRWMPARKNEFQGAPIRMSLV